MATGIILKEYTAAEVRQQIIRKNLLDNWYFLGSGSQNGVGKFPINQRRLTSYSGSGYGIDRWKINGNAPTNITTTINSNGSGLTIKDARTSGTTTNWLNQVFDNPLPTGTYTLTVLVSSLTGTAKLGILDSNNAFLSGANVNIAAGLTTVTFTVSDDSAVKAAIIVNSATTVKVSAIKLELGSYQTLAHQVGSNWVINELPNYDEELLKCQKYFQVIAPASVYLSPIGSGIAYTETQYRISVPLATAMVKTPIVTAVQNCTIKFYQDGLSSNFIEYTYAANTVSIAPGTENNDHSRYMTHAVFMFTVSGALKSKTAQMVITGTSGGSNPGIYLSAET